MQREKKYKDLCKIFFIIRLEYQCFMQKLSASKKSFYIAADLHKKENTSIQILKISNNVIKKKNHLE